MNPEQSPIKPSLKNLLSLAWPIIVSRSTQVVMGVADALMVAHLGEKSLASVTAGAMNSYAAFIFPMGIVFIVASFSSQLTGKGKPSEARAYGWYGLMVAAFAMLLALALIPFLPRIFSVFDYEPEVRAGLISYLSIRLLSTGVGVGIEALGNYYSGMGNTSILMKANLSAMALTIVLNWLLIDGHLGFPAMGGNGAALSNVLATAIAFAGFFTAFLRHGKGLPRPMLKVAEFWRMLKFGLPSGLNWSFEFFAWILFVNIVVAGLGTSALAAWMAVIQINTFSFMPAFGLGSAGAIFVGQSIGAGRKDEVPGLVRMTFLSSAAWMSLISILYIVVPALLLGPFAPKGDSSAFMAAGVLMLVMSAFWQVFDAAGITLAESLRAAGDTTYAMWARGALAWGVFLPGSWIHVRLYGGGPKASAGWLVTYLGLLAIVLYLRFRGGAWRNVKLVEESLPV